MEEEQQQGFYSAPQPQNEPQQRAAPELSSVTWTASEYIAHQKSLKWYLVLGSSSAIITILVFAVTQNILSGLVVAMACMALGVFAARQPETKQYTISEDGVQTGDKFFPYRTFKSYSIVDEDALSCVWLRPMKRFMPTVAMYYAPEDEQKIIDMLDNFLPQEDRQHDMMDRISRRIRF